MNQIILWYSIFFLYIQTYYIAIHLKSVPSITSTPRLIFEILQNTRKTMRKRSSFQLFMANARMSLFVFLIKVFLDYPALDPPTKSQCLHNI